MDAAALRVQNTTNTTSEADSHDVVLVAAPKEGQEVKPVLVAKDASANGADATKRDATT